MILAGLGTGWFVLKAGKTLRWDGQESYDGVQCLSVLWIPLVPIKTVHAFSSDGFRVQTVPLRWSWAMVCRGMVRQWMLAFIVIGGILTVIGANEFPAMSWLIPPGLFLGISGGAGWWWASREDAQPCALRRVFGLHDRGSSDPATWSAALLADVQKPYEFYGTPTFAEAVDVLLQRRRFADAMWAARHCKALEDDAQGEQLTERVLREPDVVAGLAAIGDNSRLWQALFAPLTQQHAAPVEEIDVQPAPLQDDAIQDRSRRRDDLIQRQ